MTLIEATPLYSSASNGRAERMIQTVRRQAVCLKLGVEQHYGHRVTANHTLWPWLIRHAAWSQARFHVKANRKTSYEDVYDTSYISPVVPIAETVIFRESRPDHRRFAGKTSLHDRGKPRRSGSTAFGLDAAMRPMTT